MGFPKTSEDGNRDSVIGRRIDDACLQRGWDRGELASRAGVSRTTLYQIGRGAVEKPRASTLKKVADALGVSVEQLTVGSITVGQAYKTEPVPQEAFDFDRATNSVIDSVCNDNPRLFSGWSGTDWQELYSSFGTGGQLTPDGVAQAAGHINRKRETIRRLNIVLETHLHDVAVHFIDSLYQSVQPKHRPALKSSATSASQSDDSVGTID